MCWRFCQRLEHAVGWRGLWTELASHPIQPGDALLHERNASSRGAALLHLRDLERGPCPNPGSARIRWPEGVAVDETCEAGFISQKGLKSFHPKVSALNGRNILCTLTNGEQNSIDFIQPASRCHELHLV